MRRFVVGLAMGIATFAPSWAFADDEQIARTIVEKLEARKEDGQLKGFNIDVKVDKGTVWMSGHVASTEQQQLALDIARRAEGVEAVVNDLRVEKGTSSGRTSDARRSTAANSAERPTLLGRWFGGAEADSTPARPAAKPAQRDVFVQPAAHEKSIDSVKADSPAQDTDPAAPGNDALIEILAGRLNRLKDNGSLSDFDINLTADRGVITVSGDAASAQQRDLMLDTIRRAPGVVKVINGLTVSNLEVTAEYQEPTPAAAPSSIRHATPAATEPASETSEGATQEPAPAFKVNRPSRLIRQQHSHLTVAPAIEQVDAPAAGTGVLLTAAPAVAPQFAPASAPHSLPQPVPQYTAIPIPMPPQDTAATPAPQSPPQPVPQFTAIPIPMPPQDAAPTPVARPASTSVGGYSAIPVQVVPAPFSPGAVAPIQPSAPHLAQRPLAFAPATNGTTPASNLQPMGTMPAHLPGPGIGIAPARFDHPNMPGYAWPSYAAHPNYAAVTYPKQYSPAAWPYIGPFYPYPQVPLGWRKVMLKWHDGWWYLDFKDK